MQAVETLSSSILNILQNTTKALTTKKSVIPAGAALVKTFVKNRPFIKLLFGSSDKKNAGIPIVNIATSETCDGSMG